MLTFKFSKLPSNYVSCPVRPAIKLIAILLCVFIVTDLNAAPPTNENIGVQFSYEGAIRMPFHVEPLKRELIYIAHDGSNGLYYGGHDDLVGKVELVVPKIPVNGDLTLLNIAADIVSPVLATQGQIDVQYSNPVITDLAIANGRLYLNHGKYYDVANESNSGFASINLDLAPESLEGFYMFDISEAGLLSGSVLTIPPHWELAQTFQFLLGEYWNSDGGGPNTRGISIDSQNQISSTQILAYNYNDNKTVPNFTKRDRHWGSFAITIDSSNYLGVTVQKASMAWWYGKPDPWTDPAAHRNGCMFNAGNPIQNGESCLEEWNALGDPIPPLQQGESAVDTCYSSKGYHSTSYQSLIYLFNEEALLESLTTSEQYIDPIVIDISEHMISECGKISGVATHENTLYISEGKVDDTRSAYTRLPLIHVFGIEGDTASSPAVPSTPGNLRITQ